jgi:endonuclease/exonuclease/phosphatase family metal-dependent hydrolase
MERKSVLISAILVVLLLLAIFFANASRVGPLEDCLVECSQHSQIYSKEISILNLNILHDFPNFEMLTERVDLLVEQMILLEPDIVTLQEVPWTWSTGSTARYIAEKTGMNYVYLPANGNRRLIFFAEGEAILSKFPLKNVEFVEMKPKAGLFEQRVALAATAVTPWGDLRVVSTHLTNGEPHINFGQVKALHNFVSDFEESDVIISGDFNAAEQSPQIDYLTENWVDTFRKSNPSGPGLTCCVESLSGSQIDSKLEKRIDYIFLVPALNSNVSIIDSQVIFDLPTRVNNELLWISDHAGVLTTISITR